MYTYHQLYQKKQDTFREKKKKHVAGLVHCTSPLNNFFQFENFSWASQVNQNQDSSPWLHCLAMRDTWLSYWIKAVLEVEVENQEL